MPASLIVEAFALTGFTAAAVTFGVRVLTTMVVSKLLLKNAMPDTPSAAQQQVGNRVQLNPATDNKLPVSYGDAWLNPIIVDAKLSTDNQYMWYVLAFCEKTDTGTIKFDEVYWGDKLIAFNKDAPNEIVGWYDKINNELDIRPAGKVQMYFYNNGSLSTGTQHWVYDPAPGTQYGTTTATAISILSDPLIPSSVRWTSTDLMTNTVFAIVKIKYDQNIGLTSMPAITARVQNTLKQPGSVLLDYMKNTRYGCAIDVANINTATFAVLDQYSAETISVVDGSTNLPTTFTRYEINGPIDTKVPCLTNIVTIADHADSWIQWNEKDGKWAVKINRSLFDEGQTGTDLRLVTADQIIGGINIQPIDLNSTYNSFKVSFPNKDIKDQGDFRYYEMDANDLSPNEPVNELTVSLPLCNNSAQAEYLGYRKLFSSRQDYNVTFTMDYSGIQIDAGDIIAINHDWYGWTEGIYGNEYYYGKPFRVVQVKEQKDTDGFLSVQISAVSYDDNVFTASQNPHFFTPQSFNPFKDPGYISKPAPVIISTATSTGANFLVYTPIPVAGQVMGMELWYGTTSTLSGNNYTLYSTQYNSGAPLYTNSSATNTQTEVFEVVNLPNGTYYFRSRAVGPHTVSEFSDVNTSTSIINWTRTGVIDGHDILDNSIGGSKIISGDPNQIGSSGSGGFFDNLSSTALAALGLAAAYQAYKKGWIPGFPKGETPKGGGEGGGAFDTTTTLVADNATPNVGDTVTYTITVHENYS